MSQMRAIVVDPSVPGRLALKEVAMPQPATNEALVRVAAISLTPYELKAVATAKPGTRPGWEFAGTVERAAADGSGPPEGAHVAGFLDAYMERCVKPAGLRSINSVRSRVATLKEYLGQLPLSALEDADEINRFKTESDYVEDVEIATVHRILETLRAAINWGMAQTPPLVNKSPFHRYGVRMNKKAETTRDRRIARDEVSVFRRMGP